MQYYQLLYKIKDASLMWIVKRDIDYDDLLKGIKHIWELEDYTSDVDEYYILKQNNCSQDDIEKIDELRQFTTFILDQNSELLFKSG
tara:strand:+ start:1264 stop:1524 length:261 start_codon:yes stop_codon:yes gene_type:complete